MGRGQVIVQRGLDLCKKGKREEARRIFVQSLLQEPNNALAWYGLAVCLSQREHKIESLRRSLSIDPTNEQAQQLLQSLLTDHDGARGSTDDDTRYRETIRQISKVRIRIVEVRAALKALEEREKKGRRITNAGAVSILMSLFLFWFGGPTSTGSAILMAIIGLAMILSQPRPKTLEREKRSKRRKLVDLQKRLIHLNTQTEMLKRNNLV